MKISKKELLRLEELETKARDEFISYSDYIVEEWLDTEGEKKEYRKLFNKFLANLKGA